MVDADAAAADIDRDLDEVLEPGLDPLEEPPGVRPEPGGVQEAAVGGSRELLSHARRRVGAVLWLS